VRWEHKGKLWIVDRVEQRSFRSPARSALRETDFYRFESDADDKKAVPPLVIETMLAEIEGAAVGAIDAVIDNAALAQVPENRLAIATLMAAQHVRGRRFRSGVASLSGGLMQRTTTARSIEELRTQYGEAVSDADVAQLHEMLEKLRSGEVTVEPQKEWTIGLALSMMEPVAAEIHRRQWAVFESPVPLLTSDEPVVLIGGPRMPRGALPGISTAGAIFMALDPSHLLVAFATQLPLDVARMDRRLTAQEAAEINLEIAAHAHRVVIAAGRADSAPRLPSLPPRMPTAVVEEEVPILNTGDDSTVFHAFHPSPWLYVPNQPLPVARWWTDDQRITPGSRADTPWVPKAGIALTDEGLWHHRRESGTAR
jgi:hypothetical protein